MKKMYLIVLSYVLIPLGLSAQTKGLVISEIFTNPSGNDSPFEYVELVATTNINFATTPYSVVFTDNGTATSNGWKEGGSVSYGFTITSGSVVAGQVVYVGGTSMLPLSNGGVSLKSKNTGSSSGDTFGSSNSAGVLGQGGSNADGVAVFNVAASSISASTVPVDAIFFGSGVGSAFKTTSSGYQLPVNDKYAGGKLQTSSFIAPDPASGEIIKAVGVFNPSTDSFATVRTWSITTTATYNTSSVTLTSGVNQAPVISITAPVGGASFTAPASVSITANATDADGTIASVEFYNGTTLLGSDTASPYSFTWSGVAVGSYTITTKAYDNLSAVTTSSAVNITVNASGSNQAPIVSITTPVTGASFTAPASVSITATASDADGSVAKVEFYNGAVLLGSDTSSPYSYSWSSVAAGSYSITVKAYDNLNVVTTSSAVSITVNGANVAPTLSFNTTASKLVDLASGKVSCVMNNATDPFIVTGLDINVGDENLNTVTFSMTSSKTSVVSNANFTITGTGTARKFKITPTAVGYTTITLKVTDAQGLNKSISLSLAVSASLATAATKDIYNTGVADGSTAIPVDANYMFVADDETNVIKLYDRNNSGLSIYQFDVNPYLNLGGTEVDMEASFRSPTNPNRIYWMGSLSNSKSGEARPDRNRIFATDIVGTGANATLVFVGYYSNLRSKIITWGDANGYNFTSKAATGIEPKRIDGFNIEGLEMGPDGTTMYIAFRAPYVGTGTNKALICPLINFESWFGNGSPSASPTFGSPIELNLNNHGIRSLGKNASNQYLIVAGSYAATGTFELYSWNGQAATAPVLLNVDLANLKPEGIVDVPASISGAFTVDLVSDLGSNILYNDGLENKDVVEPNHRKFLTSTLQVNAGSTARIASKDQAKELETTKMYSYPNPINTTLNIVFDENQYSNTTAYVYNTVGALVKTVLLNNSDGKATIDFSDLGAGLYFVNLPEMAKVFQIIKE
ncbi:Ig-like domain-containing protein [Flavobacterium sp. 5]|uniref:Ig-like domain-containing protein n=1 Tax=Flavobacterium sp. 5 TaxID=2035199 RepID=UPI000C2BDD91|nr:Ig-like domain-containing protein [Flavobacterium sp. 5]PKB17733.1 putative secreted protein (Por secretion system target) [Flavobacterium sp. 5]